MSKYNRTFHLPFSPEVHSDDKVIDMEDLNYLINQELVITEKADGGNTCIIGKKVYARSHSEEASHPSFSMVKQMVNLLNLPNNLYIYGENMQGIHSIDYNELSSPFYLFGIKEGEKWFSWNELERFSQEYKLPLVPVVFKGKFNSLNELKEFLDIQINKPSLFNKNVKPEGFVVRNINSFENKEFSKNIAKYVRKGHVQTDEHWTRNWQEANISKNFWNSLY